MISHSADIHDPVLYKYMANFEGLCYQRNRPIYNKAARVPIHFDEPQVPIAEYHLS